MFDSLMARIALWFAGGWMCVALAGKLCAAHPQDRETPTPARTERREVAPDSPVACENPSTFRFRVGIRIQVVDGPIQRSVASTVIPMDWPEQQVRLLNTEAPAGWRVQSRHVGGTAEQLLLTIPQAATGSEIAFTRTYEVTRWTQRLRPEARDRLTAAPAAKLRAYLEPSDGIESSHPEIRRFANEVVGEGTDPLVRASALFRATQKQVRYVDGKFAGALAGLRTGLGDCEELSCLFIAGCRAAGIPARLVRGPGHCWTEFAVSDSNGDVVWVPADPTKERQIGVVTHSYPILQKGDRFKLPELGSEPVRYLTSRCTGQGPAPQLETIEEIQPISDDSTQPASPAP